MKRLIIFIFSIFNIMMAMAQDIRISGTVNDAMGPVMMCNVVEIDGNNRIVSNAQTDINGGASAGTQAASSSSAVSEIFSDHPSTEKRIAAMSQRATQDGYKRPAKK